MRSTPPLSPEFTADIDAYLPVIQRAWKSGTGYSLAQWQVDILRGATEQYPEGHKRAGQLRHRQAFLSVGRQAGKSELTAAFGLYLLLRDLRGAYVVGVARSREQAALIYDRTLSVIQSNPALASRFKKLTETRGIRAVAGGRYELKASSSASLQGIPVSGAVCDELHLLKPEVWDALVAGTGGRRNTLVFGATTAGDDESELLQRLYVNAEKSFAGELDRFYAVIYDAPEARVPDDDETLAQYITAANPAVQGGYKDVEAVMSDVRGLPKSEAIRYYLNRFISGNSGWMDLGMWTQCASTEAFPKGRPVISIDRTNDWSAATFAAAIKREDGTLFTELVAWPRNPTIDQLERLCIALYAKGVATFVVDSFNLRELGLRLKGRGMPVRFINVGDVYSGASLFYSKVAHKEIRHGGDLLLTMQIPRTATKARGDDYRLIKGPTLMDIDSVIATVNAVYVAENNVDMGLQLF
ncbi:terminase large subunit domain-containing protein [Frigoribacterium faeni]|uniref:Phage terminase large subunit-like protein n=1 Tax=Frigoribacterium faeni TaxID=145483 RepID=A0A7W3JGF9_9MICO|nr:terminase large subunit [Frigoribacterium faeni]MBA8812422.1 phage terminase large subunit-like protein [Frigoribacterium faeni]BFF13495.1 hypothetical protein GCM10025699_47980 [Microbacterium flavescens]GEK81861.1 hypothetical protein FFA01_01700 [Frigoribacterium faeni]